MRNGTRITGKANEISDSFVHMSVPTPTFSGGHKIFVKSLMMVWRTSFPFNGEFVEVSFADIWDGHFPLDLSPEHQWSDLNNKYTLTKLIVNSRRPVYFGLNISFRVKMEPRGSNQLAWAEFASAGAEFVSRHGTNLSDLNQSQV